MSATILHPTSMSPVTSAPSPSQIATALNSTGTKFGPVQFNHWDQLSAQDQQDCFGDPASSTPDNYFAWYVRGCLLRRWNLEIRGHVVHVFNTHKERSIPLRIVLSAWLQKESHLPVSPDIRLLCRTNEKEKAKPHIVLRHSSKSLLRTAISLLDNDTFLERFGLTNVIAHREKFTISAGRDHDAPQPLQGNIYTASGLGIVACAVPLTGATTFRKGTIGGVLRMGPDEYYGLVSAHLLFDDTLSDIPSSDDTGSDSSLEFAEDQVDSTIASGSGTRRIAATVDKSKALYLLAGQTESTESQVSKSNIAASQSRDSPAHALSQGKRYVGKGSELRAPQYGVGQMYSPEFDWALVELDPQLWLPNRTIYEGRAVDMRPGWGNDDPPQCELLIVTGTQGNVKAKGIGSKTAISLPWMSQLVEVWQIIASTGVGACGSWVIEPTSGLVCGIVIAHVPGSETTFMLPADQVFCNILKSWNGEYDTVQQLFQLGDAKLSDNLEAYNTKPFDSLELLCQVDALDFERKLEDTFSDSGFGGSLIASITTANINAVRQPNISTLSHRNTRRPRSPSENSYRSEPAAVRSRDTSYAQAAPPSNKEMLQAPAQPDLRVHHPYTEGRQDQLQVTSRPNEASSTGPAGQWYGNLSSANRPNFTTTYPVPNQYVSTPGPLSTPAFHSLLRMDVRTFVNLPNLEAVFQHLDANRALLREDPNTILQEAVQALVYVHKHGVTQQGSRSEYAQNCIQQSSLLTMLRERLDRSDESEGTILRGLQKDLLRGSSRYLSEAQTRLYKDMDAARRAADIRARTLAKPNPQQNVSLGMSQPVVSSSLQPRNVVPDFATMTLQPSTRTGQAVPSTVSQTSSLDPNYHVRPASFYVRGRVFLHIHHQYWGEVPRLDDRGSQQTTASGRSTLDEFGERVHTEARRMVVIKAGRGSAVCVTVTTYGGRGLGKYATPRDDEEIETHAQIYMADGPGPVWLPKEPRSSKRAIAVKRSSPRQYLLPASRICFAKPYTIQFTDKTQDVGLVTEESMPYLLRYFKQANEV